MSTNYQNNISFNLTIFHMSARLPREGRVSFNLTIFHMSARLPREGRVRGWSHFLLRDKAVLLLWIIYAIFVFILLCFHARLFLMPCGHLLGKGRPFGSSL